MGETLGSAILRGAEKFGGGAAEVREARSYKAATGVRCDGFRTVPLDVSKEKRREVLKFIFKSGTVWDMAAACLYDDVFLDS